MTLEILFDLLLLITSIYSLVLTAAVVYLYLSIKQLDKESLQLAQIMQSFMNTPQDDDIKEIEGYNKNRNND
mgnify:CR=1 FL=1